MKKIDLNKLSFSELKKEIENLESLKEVKTKKSVGVYTIGEKYVFRTVTMIQVGKLVDVQENELVIEDAAWVADTGRWTDFLKTGKVSEVEPFPDGKVIIGRNAIIDVCVWKHELLRDQK